MKIYYTLLFTILYCFLLNAQSEKKLQKINKKFDKYQFTNSIEEYEYLLSKGYPSTEIYTKLGDANYYNSNYKEALVWYQKLIDNGVNVPISTEYHYRYIQSLKSNGYYEKASIYIDRFIQKNPEDIRALKLYENKDYLNTIEQNSGRHALKNLDINSIYSDIAPSFYGEQLVFSSARDTGFVRKNVHLWDNNTFKDLYVATISDTVTNPPVKFSKDLNFKTEESTTVFTKDGTTVYFTRTNFVKKRFKRDTTKTSRLKLYSAHFRNNEWTNIKELPFNSDTYSVAHPALNVSETFLYFVSDMPGSKGSSDIFKVEIKADGGFGEPINLGENVNTESRETFPYIADDNCLYFASDGHAGLGGLDVFKVDELDTANAKILNLGKPINSTQDDFGYIVNEEKKTGYFVSNRKGGKGNDDIYAFLKSASLEAKAKEEFTFNGTVKEKYTNKPVVDAIVEVVDESNNRIAEKLSKSDGTFSLKTKLSDGKYKVRVSKYEYEATEKSFEINNLESNYEVEVVMLKKNYKKSEVGQDLTKVLDIGINNLYFDLDKAIILPEAEAVLERIVEYLNKYPTLNIDIRSHTDASGNSAYNLELSQRRAHSTANYLIGKGIDISRLTYKGYGETQLINNCKNFKNCTEEENKLNRRSEFIVVKKNTSFFK